MLVGSSVVIVSSVWLLCHLCGHRAIHMFVGSSMWSLGHPCGCRAIHVVIVPSIWSLCHSEGLMRCKHVLGGCDGGW